MCGPSSEPLARVRESPHDGARCLDLGDRVDAARAGRRFVEEQAIALGAAPLADDAALVAAELLANACQHGSPPYTVCIRGDHEFLRVEVLDGSSRTPVRPAQSTANMTGRGLALIEALSVRWGVERADDGGKVVWAELDQNHTGDVAQQIDVDAMLVAWDDDSPATPERRFTVVLGDVPTALLLEAKSHIDNVVREFTLAATSRASGGSEVPEYLARLIETVVHGFRDARDAIKRQALAAASRGDVRTALTLHLPATAADAGEAYLAALDEADEYSRAARLLTLETPPDHRLFRRWYVQAVIRQLREVAAGSQPQPVVSFEQVLLSEVRQLTAAQRVIARSARLQRVTAALARSRTPEDVAAVVVSEGVDALGASGGGLVVPAPDGEHISVPGVVGYGEQLVGQLREESIDAPLPAATVLRSGESVWLESQEERDREFPALHGFESSTIAMCAVPLRIGDRTIGALRFSFSARKLFDDDERAFVLALAALTAQTLQRTELYEAERQAALDLQRALLPASVPAVRGWDIAAYYSPAGDQEAGGDFYDVICLPDGRFVAIVGDVMGRGVEAAAAMAQIRSTIRAYALDDPEPVSVFQRVDAFFDVLDLAQLVTVLYLLVDPESGVVHLGNAGHLPPLLLDGGSGRVLPTATGTPFGVANLPRDVVMLELPPANTLVVVTDGLVERRGEDIDHGLARILRAAVAAPGTEAQTVLSHVVTAGGGRRIHDDDVTVLVLRRD